MHLSSDAAFTTDRKGQICAVAHTLKHSRARKASGPSTNGRFGRLSASTYWVTANSSTRSTTMISTAVIPIGPYASMWMSFHAIFKEFGGVGGFRLVGIEYPIRLQQHAAAL
jgi:hypothetical protein